MKNLSLLEEVYPDAIHPAIRNNRQNNKSIKNPQKRQNGENKMTKPKKVSTGMMVAFMVILLLFSAVIILTPNEQEVIEMAEVPEITTPETTIPEPTTPVPPTVAPLTTAPHLPENYHWVGTWATSNYYGDPASSNGGIRDAGNAARTLPNATLRQMIRTAIAGDIIRLTFSNQFGDTPLTINAASIALASGNNGTSNIDTATNTPITFEGGEGRITIPPGEFITSDELYFPVEALQRLAVSTYFGQMPEFVTSHIAARANSFVQPGNNVNNAAVQGTTNTHWFVLAGVDVLTAPEVRSIVVIGDSLTDGFGVTNEAYTRWVDVLMNKLQANPETRHLSVINMGIGGNGLVGSAFSNPPAARHLYRRDVLEQPGVGYVVFQIGVNNLAFSPSITFEAMVEAYTEMINLAHAQGIKVYGGTITPFNADQAYREAMRQDVNNWIRRQYAEGRIYGLIDFDEILRCPENPARLLPAIDRDGIHPTNAGYVKMAEGMYEIITASGNGYRLTITSQAENATLGGYYAQGAVKQINAGDAPEGFEFRAWTSAEVEFADEYSPATSFTMPAANVSVIANFTRIGGDPCENCGFISCDNACYGWEFADGMDNSLRTFSLRPVGGFTEGQTYRIEFDITHESMAGMRVRWAGQPAPDHNGPWLDGEIVNQSYFQAGGENTFGYLPAHFTQLVSGEDKTFTVEFTFTTEGLTELPPRGDYWAVITGSQQRNEWTLEAVRVD